MKLSLSAVALVVTGLTTLMAPLAPAGASGIFSSSYNASTIFTDAPLSYTTMTLTYDGTHYFSTSGGYYGGTNEAEYDSAGHLISTFKPGLDFRSNFTGANGAVLARQFAN